MTYVCIKCRKVWVKGKITNHASGALCDSCMTDYVRARQIGEGFHDCYARATELCSRRECSYWKLCNREVGE